LLLALLDLALGEVYVAEDGGLERRRDDGVLYSCMTQPDGAPPCVLFLFLPLSSVSSSNVL
jgi:hypothetical protein